MIDFIKEVIFMISSLFRNINVSPQLKESKFFPFKDYRCLMWCGYILCKNTNNITSRTIRHEQIHINQAKTNGSWFMFYLCYLYYYIKSLIKYKNTKKAYLFNPYEMEAYANDHLNNYNINTNRYIDLFNINKFDNIDNYYVMIKTI